LNIYVQLGEMKPVPTRIIGAENAIEGALKGKVPN